MTVEEIKQQYSMADVVVNYGFQPNRANFIKCPFHTGDRTPSMKIYKDSFHCFGCGANGDIFTFVQMIDDCDFKTAFISLGGSYENATKSQKIRLYRAQKAREQKAKENQREKNSKTELMKEIDMYRSALNAFEPLSDEWAFCQEELQKLLIKYEEVGECGTK